MIITEEAIKTLHEVSRTENPAWGVRELAGVLLSIFDPPKPPLLSLEEANARAKERRERVDLSTRMTGVACPTCAKELAQSGLGVDYGGGMGGYDHVHCPSCGWVGAIDR